jgi:hypothetical protein
MLMGVNEGRLTDLPECTTQGYKQREAYWDYVELRLDHEDSYGSGYDSSHHRYLT